MAASMTSGSMGGLEPRRARRHPLLVPGLVGGGVAVALLALWFLQPDTVRDRPNEMKTTRVVLPPPPPPPPPPPKPIEQEKPPEPIIAPPIDKPVDTPPPPEAPSSEPVAGDNALTAREGAGPSNYGLAVGNGSGTRIGGRPGGGDNGFAAYAGIARTAIQVATQADRELARGKYTVRLMVAVDAEGRITDARVIDSSGDTRRDDRLRRLLTGLQLSQRPPAGLPAMRIELNSRSGA